MSIKKFQDKSIYQYNNDSVICISVYSIHNLPNSDMTSFRNDSTIISTEVTLGHQGSLVS